MSKPSHAKILQATTGVETAANQRQSVLEQKLDAIKTKHATAPLNPSSSGSNLASDAVVQDMSAKLAKSQAEC